MRRLSTFSNAGPFELDHIDLDAGDGEVVDEAPQHFLGVAARVERGVDEVDPEDAERLLLLEVLPVPHADVHEDVVRGAARFGLEADAHPAVRLLATAVALGRDRVREDEELGGRPALDGQPFDDQHVLPFQHREQAGLAHVPLVVAVDRVAHDHVVGGDALGDRPARAADPEEPPGDFLSGSDLGEDTVFPGVEVDLKSLLVGVQAVAHR